MKLPGLVKLLAEGDERGEAAIAHIARIIREAGHLPTTKRGRGASDMGVLEAANLLIAANATDVPAKVSEAVETFRNLRQIPVRKNEGGFDIRASKGWKKILVCKTFGEALEALFSINQRDIDDICETFNKVIGANKPLDLIVFRSVRFVWPDCAASVMLNIANADSLRDGFRRDADLSGKRIELQFGLTEADRLFLEEQKPSGRIHEVTVRDAVIRRLAEACAAMSGEAIEGEVAA
ncbi:hypothetical protein [Methylobacterium durans]|uniref:Uncharacterized protein n=1 Tax=Methylobacterium durans TaxID=2202825 RepID=A0A2U8WBH3_9HYPH|nr:hypothetical protein [Methylobacterium durans]AWN43433.1 hypothetical protein DK389_26640 [Methylobacterium durans]